MPSPIPEGFGTVTPFLCVVEAASLIDFIKAAFGATVTVRMDGTDGSPELRKSIVAAMGEHERQLWRICDDGRSIRESYRPFGQGSSHQTTPKERQHMGRVKIATPAPVAGDSLAVRAWADSFDAIAKGYPALGIALVPGARIGQGPNIARSVPNEHPRQIARSPPRLHIGSPGVDRSHSRAQFSRTNSNQSL